MKGTDGLAFMASVGGNIGSMTHHARLKIWTLEPECREILCNFFAWRLLGWWICSHSCIARCAIGCLWCFQSWPGGRFSAGGLGLVSGEKLMMLPPSPHPTKNVT